MGVRIRFVSDPIADPGFHLDGEVACFADCAPQCARKLAKCTSFLALGIQLSIFADHIQALPARARATPWRALEDLASKFANLRAAGTQY